MITIIRWPDASTAYVVTFPVNEIGEAVAYMGWLITEQFILEPEVVAEMDRLREFESLPIPGPEWFAKRATKLSQELTNLVCGGLWKTTPQRWQHLRGVHQPWIAEIAPSQMGAMSDRRRAAYMKERGAQWEASAACKDEWNYIVRCQYVKRRFSWKDTGVTEEAKSLCIHTDIARYKRHQAEAFDRLTAKNFAHDAQVGDVVFDMISYGVIVKASAKSVRVDHGFNCGPGYKASRGQLRWLHYNELKAQADALAVDITRRTMGEFTK